MMLFYTPEITSVYSLFCLPFAVIFPVRLVQGFINYVNVFFGVCFFFFATVVAQFQILDTLEQLIGKQFCR